MLRATLGALDSAIEAISRYTRYLQYAAACLMGLTITADVMGRFFFNKPLSGGPEIVRQLMACTIFLILPYVTAAKRHISVEVFFERLPLSGQRVADLVIDIVVLVTLALLGWRSFVGAFQSKLIGEVTENLLIPHYLFRLMLAASFSFAALTMFKNISQDITNIRG